MSPNVAAGPTLDQLRPAKATITTAELSGGIGVDEGASITYTEGHGFDLTWWFAPDPHGPLTQVRHLEEDDLAVLLERINVALDAPPSGLDVSALEAFRKIVEDNLGPRGNIFAGVEFGNAEEEIFGGHKTVLGHIALGVDVVGTVRDADGQVTWERHVLPLPPGAFRPLTPGERSSLAEALEMFLKDRRDPGWEAILEAITA